MPREGLFAGSAKAGLATGCEGVRLQRRRDFLVGFCRGEVIKISSIEGEQGLWSMVFKEELARQLWEL